MSRLRRRERRLDRLRRPHLPDQDHIRILTEGGVKSCLIIFHICSDLALIDDGTFRRIHVLDRILQRDDMKRSRRVNLFQDRRERRRFSASRLACHKDDPLIPF